MPEMNEGWSALYKQAIRESDRCLLPARIDEASEAIRRRSRELWYEGAFETMERHELDAALYFLRLLRKVRSGDSIRQWES